MKTQIIYVLVSGEGDLYLEELWASAHSLRLFHPEACVRVLCDEPTAQRIAERPALAALLTEVRPVATPEGYNAKQRSRQIKTTVRQLVEGPYLFIDTDTVVCRPLDGLDSLRCDLAAVPDGHLPLSRHTFRESVHANMLRCFGDEACDCPFWFNSGVMFVADNERTHAFYRRWNELWTHSTFEKGMSQDQPALLLTDKEAGYVIEQLPPIYNCQVALSLEHFHEAAIVHFWHMDFIADQSYSPYFSLAIYREIKEARAITPHVDELVRRCKSTFLTPTMPVGEAQITFLFSAAGQAFSRIHAHGTWSRRLMNRVGLLLFRYWRLKRKVRNFLNPITPTS